MSTTGSSPPQTGEQDRSTVCRFSRSARHPGASRSTYRSSPVSPSPTSRFGKMQSGTGFGKTAGSGGVC